MEGNERIDSFTIGTPATGGSIKVYFDSDAEDKIRKTKELYYTYVELDKIKKAGGLKR